MSDRPERPPVWVRGGAPYYYSPQNSYRQDVPPQALMDEARRRRSSTGSTTSSAASREPGSPPMGSALLPGFPAASPTAAAAYQTHSRQSPSQYPSGQSQSQFLTGHGAPPQLPNWRWNWGSKNNSNNGSNGSDIISTAAAAELGGVPSGISRQQNGNGGGGGSSSGDFPGRGSRSSSFGNLNMQKRGSADEMMNMRRQSWKEMGVGTDPAGHRFWRKWWDGYTKGGNK